MKKKKFPTSKNKWKKEFRKIILTELRVLQDLKSLTRETISIRQKIDHQKKHVTLCLVDRKLLLTHSKSIKIESYLLPGKTKYHVWSRKFVPTNDITPSTHRSIFSQNFTSERCLCCISLSPTFLPYSQLCVTLERRRLTKKKYTRLQAGSAMDKVWFGHTGNTKIREAQQDQGNRTDDSAKTELKTGLKYKLNQWGDEVQVEWGKKKNKKKHRWGESVEEQGNREGVDKLGITWNRSRLIKKMQCRCGGKANWGRAREARKNTGKGAKTTTKPRKHTKHWQDLDTPGTKMK